MSEKTVIKIDPIERVQEMFGKETADKMKELLDNVKKKDNTVQLDMRPIFVTLVTTALLWGKDAHSVTTSDVYGKVMDLMNMFFKD